MSVIKQNSRDFLVCYDWDSDKLIVPDEKDQCFLGSSEMFTLVSYMTLIRFFLEKHINGIGPHSILLTVS